MAVEEGSDESVPSVTPLADVFNSNSEPEERSSSSGDETPAKDETKDEASQKFVEGDASPEKQDAKPDKTEKPSSDVKKEPDKPLDAKKDDAKEEKPSDEKDKWDSEENPYVKRYKDTASNWNREHQEKLQLQQQLQKQSQDIEVLKKIADGTYDPEKDDPARHVTPEVIASQALNVGKALASKTAAIEQHGKDVVEQRLTQFHEKFGDNPVIQSIVLNSESPVHEAFRILDRLDFETKYGSTPADIYKNVRAEVEKELTPKLKEQLTAEIMGRADKKKHTPTGLSSSRGSNGLDSKDQNSKDRGPTPLRNIFS